KAAQNPGTQPQDVGPIPLYAPKFNGTMSNTSQPVTDYSIYKIQVGSTEPSTSTFYPLMNVPGNVTGTPSMLRTEGAFTTATTRTSNNANPTPPVNTAVDPQNGGYFLVGPSTDSRDQVMSKAPAGTPWYQCGGAAPLEYSANVAGTTWSIN